jgi:hypothetical protein
MALPESSFIANLRKIVTEHYEKDTSPLLLSNLGATLQKKSLWPCAEAAGMTLRRFIEATHDPDLLIVRDANSPAYVAVTTQATKIIVEKFIERRRQSTAAIPDLESLPRAVLLAFCVRQQNNRPVFLRKLPPFRYATEEPDGEESDQFLRIDERYRRPGLKVENVAELSASDRLDLQAKIAAWSTDNDVQLGDFYKLGERKRRNALERLLAAQPPGLAGKIMIPADIALILSKSE